MLFLQYLFLQQNLLKMWKYLHFFFWSLYFFSPAAQRNFKPLQKFRNNSLTRIRYDNDSLNRWNTMTSTEARFHLYYVTIMGYFFLFDYFFFCAFHGVSLRSTDVLKYMFHHDSLTLSFFQHDACISKWNTITPYG